ncbi:class I adenylate-forming enzyme family protein [Pelistega ratti]|uniref:class I adenylate-forming enzyme family protein n=1 Tax=Pelistega ratti TaxID=2652177 RepID=UPI00135768DD|nr:class I adenylate-forming enzyme family protein [Pelistega ratti]
MISIKDLRNFTQLYKEKICIVDKNSKYTWEDILEKTNQLLMFLLTKFQTKELVSVCYLTKNNVDIICWLAALATLKIPVTGIDYSLPLSTVKKLLIKINPSLLLVSSDLYSTNEIDSLKIHNLKVINIHNNAILSQINSGELYSEDLDNLLSKHIPPKFCSISLTSGTSSIPKVVIRHNTFESKRFSWFIQRFNFCKDDGFMLILPLYHAAGNSWARMFMGLGATLYLVDQSNNEEMLKAITTNPIKTTVMTPILLTKLINLVKENNLTPHLKWILVGGSHFPIQQKLDAISIFGDVLCEYYGCTETGVNVLADSFDMKICPESVGKAFEGNQVIILNEDNTPIQSSIPGKVAISSYMLMDQYKDGKNPFITINNKKFFIMPDYGYIRENRLILMNRNGNSSCKDDIYHLENAIRNLFFIKDIALTTLRLKEENQILCIFSSSESKLIDEEQKLIAIRELAEQLGYHNFSVKEVTTIPYSPSGKVRINEIFNIFGLDSQ